MDKKVIITFLNIVVAVILVLVFIDPLWTSVGVLRLEADDQNQEVKKVEDLLAKIQAVEQDYQDVVEAASKISLALPKEKDLPYLITQFETLALTNGLLLESVNFDEQIERSIKDDSLKQEEGISPFPYLTINVRLSGSYEGLKGYLKSLESSVRLMEVREIDFVSQQGQSNIDLSGLSIFKFGLKILVFYQ